MFNDDFMYSKQSDWLDDLMQPSEHAGYQDHDFQDVKAVEASVSESDYHMPESRQHDFDMTDFRDFDFRESDFPVFDDFEAVEAQVPPFGNIPGVGPSINTRNPQLPPPPSFVPAQPRVSPRVDASSMRFCMGRFTYVWLNNGNAFWMFPIQVGRTSVSGFRWNNRFGWTFFGINLRNISAFTCI